MKKQLLITLLLFLGWTSAFAQLPPGSIAPDFTATDLNGQSHNLYDLLDAGKTVYIDFSATWCGPCWNYHNTHALRDIWELYGPDGTDEAFVLFIESDASTNTDCLYGLPSCVGGTQGDWVTGTPYPIIDDASIKGPYQVAYYPTIYMVCPADKKVYETGQLNATGLWSRRTQYCTTPEVAIALNSVDDVSCQGGSDGSVNITPGGVSGPFTFAWSNGATTEDLFNVPAGTYTVTVTSVQGWTGVSDPIDVAEPAQALSVSLVETTPVGCNGVLGSITVSADGGWYGFSYHWSGGQLGETGYNLNTGNHTVTVSDAGGCTTTFTHYLPPAVFPDAEINAPPQITCAHPSIQLDATNSSNGPDYSYQWYASNGGNIVSGANTLTPVVNAAGNYTLQVTNDETTCAGFAVTVVNADLTLPASNAGVDTMVTCTNPEIELDGSGSVGNNFSYLWTAINGGHIVSGANTLEPIVDSTGDYILRVTNSTNGCVKRDTVNVGGSNVPPSVAVAHGILTCLVTQQELTTTTNAQNPGFAWTGPGGFNSNLQNPVVSAQGDYTVVVTDSLTACTKTHTTTVAADLAGPGATATGGSLTCIVLEVQLTGNTMDSVVTYAWSGPNGFTSNLQNPVVNNSGDYTLVVTAADNGCTSSAMANVANNTTPPLADAETPGALNCNNDDLQLDGTGSQQGNNISYLWSTADGNIVSGENTQTPLIDAPGLYTILVTNANTGCTNTAQTAVVQRDPVSAGVSGQINVSCHGLANGSATALGSGGDSNFSYLWSSGDSTATATNLSAGAYQVSVSDGEGCTATANVTITQPAVLVANASATGETALGANDGAATANPNGGTQNYAYAWSNGESTQTISGLAPGNYTVTVTDANNCTDVQNVTVNAFNCALSASITAVQISCFGANNGSATANVTGGADPVNYTWSNGQTTQTITNLAPGPYTVEIVDANNCPAILNVSITQPLELDPNASATGETSLGANDGTATANPVGGVAPYDFAWSNGQTNQTITNLAPGAYTVVITDENGCTASQTVIVNGFNCALAGFITTTAVACYGGSDGTATATVNGGTAPYTYLWSHGATTATVNNLPAGNYSVTISDDNDCETILSTVVVQPVGPVSLSLTNLVNVVCPEDESGLIEVQGSGGTAPITYLWNNGATGSTLQNAGPGTYVLTATDANGCTQMSSYIISATDDVAPTVVCPENMVVCAYDNTVSFANPAVQDNCSTDNGALALTEGLPSGSVFPAGTTTTQTFVFRDASGNEGECSFDITVTEPVDIVVVNVVHDDGNMGNGAIDVSVGGGEGLSFVWTLNDEVVGETEDIENLFAGVYHLLVTDAFGCEYQTEVEVTGSVGTNTPAWMTEVQLRPNPASEMVQLVLPARQEFDVQLLDLTGRVLHAQQSVSQPVLEIPLQRIPAGVYLVHIRSGSEAGMVRLVVQ